MSLKKNNIRLAAASVALLCGTAAFGQTVGAGMQAVGEQPVGRLGNAQIFGGVRLWATSFEFPVIGPVTTVDPANPSAPPVTKDVEQRFSSSKVAAIPFIGIRYGDLVASVSYFTKTSYDSKGLLNGDVRRDELDVNAGYYVLPQLALSLAYKRGDVDKISRLVSGGSRTEALLAGASGSVPLDASSRLALYGNFAYGLGRSKTDFTLPTGDNSLDVSYRIGEIGLAYRLLDAPTPLLKSLSLSLGYRAQFVTFKDAGFATYSGSAASPTVSSVERRNIQSTTDGLVIGLIGVF